MADPAPRPEADLKPARMPALDGLRVGAFGLVAFHHLALVEEKYAGDTILWRDLTLGVSGVDLFFMVSGFMIGRLFFARGREEGATLRAAGAARFAFDRAARIYPLYWLVFLLLLGPYLIDRDLVFAGRGADPPDLVSSFFLLPDLFMPMHVVAWTLVHLMAFYAGSTLVLLAPRAWRAAMLVVWAGLSLFAHVNLVETLDPELVMHPGGAGAALPWLAVAASPFTLQFTLGALLGMARAPGPRLARAATAFGLLWLVLVAIACIVNQTDIRGLLVLERVAILTPGAAALTLGLSAVRTGPPAMAMVARAGYALYLTHVIGFSLVGRIWGRIAQPGPLDNLIVLALMAGGALVGAVVVERRVERPLVAGVRALWPGRRSRPAPRVV